MSNQMQMSLFDYWQKQRGVTKYVRRISYDETKPFLLGIGMKMAKRPNSGALKGKDGVFVEPIWIWQKR